jgi:uncharacterized membrane protein (DUF485 family)
MMSFDFSSARLITSAILFCIYFSLVTLEAFASEHTPPLTSPSLTVNLPLAHFKGCDCFPPFSLFT